MSHKSLVHKHIAAALCILAAIYSAVFLLVPATQVSEPVSRLVFAASLLGFLALPLLAGIATSVHARYSDSNLIQGYKAEPSERLSFLRAYNQNTLEQTVLHALGLVSFCAVAPVALVSLAYAQVAAFLLGRFMFFVGYQREPTNRLVGFAVGYYPAIAAVVASVAFTCAAA